MNYSMQASRWMLGALLSCPLLGAQELPAPTPAIAGVVAAGTAVEIVKEGFDGTEGPLPQPDGGLLFTENRANRIIRITLEGATEPWMAPAAGANALAVTQKGEIVAALTEKPSIGVITPGQAPRLLVEDFDGRPFQRPNDLVTGKRGQVYFTDPGVAVAGQPGPSTAVYHLAADGHITRLADDIRRPNGIALSPDERTLYVADTGGEWIIAFDLDSQGAVKQRRQFVQLAGVRQTETGPASGADGLAVDEKGRLYVATTIGVQVFSNRGAALGVIALPKAPQNLAFAGKDRSTLYVVGRGSVYRIATATRGPRRAGK